MLKQIITLISFTTISLYGFEYNLSPKKISNNVWCFLGKLEIPTKENGGFMSNSCYIKTENSYIIIDSGPSYQFAKQAYTKMKNIAALPVKLVISTHNHDDHWLGNNYYKESFETNIVGPSSINKSFKQGDKTRMFQILSKDAIKGSKIIRIDKEIKSITDLKIDNTKLTIIPIGTKAHTSEDLFVYLPDEKIVFSGDLVMNGRITSNRDGSVIGSLKALDIINDKEWTTLIPGHGFDTSKSAMNESKKYFSMLKNEIMKAVENEVGAANITKVVTLKEFEHKAMYKELNKRNIFDAYNELEFYEE